MDVFDFSLYSMLTFMSCISLLLYLEQCVFIYKKLPTPKKTTLIWTSGAAPVSIRACFVCYKMLLIVKKLNKTKNNRKIIIFMLFVD